VGKYYPIKFAVLDKIIMRRDEEIMTGNYSTAVEFSNQGSSSRKVWRKKQNKKS